MLKLLLAALAVILAALLACTGATPAPDPTEAQAPASIVAGTPLPATTATPEAAATSTPGPTVRPTEVTPATSAPASSPTPEPTPDGSLAPIVLQDSHSLQSALSEAELGCIGDSPEELAFALRGPGPESPEEQERLLNCLHDETLYRLFLAGFVPGSEPLSLEASDCIREAFDVIDPRSVMMAGIEGDPGRAMAGGMAAMTATIACLTDEEWQHAGPEMGLGLEDREAGQCLLEALGGLGEMAAAMTAAQKGDVATLAGAGAKCGLDMGPPGQTPTGPSPAPTPVPLPTQVNQAPSQAQDIPALTDDQVTKMNESISGDVLLTVMLQGGYTINDYGPWVAGDRTFIGAIAEIFLTTPTDYQGSLPMVGFEPAEDGSKEYRSRTFNITASGIKSVFILGIIVNFSQRP